MKKVCFILFTCLIFTLTITISLPTKAMFSQETSSTIEISETISSSEDIMISSTIEEDGDGEENEDMISTPEYMNSIDLITRDITSNLPDMKTPDKPGIYMIVPIRLGFTQQPQKEQYIVEGKYADLAVKTTSWIFVSGRRTATVYGWKQNADGSWGSKTYYGDFKSPRYNVLSTRQSISIALEKLTEGEYYFQVESVLEKNIFLRDVTYYSELAKVTVVPNEIPASQISIGSSNPYVIFEETAYPTNAVTTPINSTSTISWSNRFIGSTATDQFTYSPEFGRYTYLESENPSDALMSSVNTSVSSPGIPVVITATATNHDGTSVKGERQSYYGGLIAKEVDANTPFTWSLNIAGINELSEISETNTGWAYEWEYTDELTGKTTKLSQLPNTTGIINHSGSVSKLTDLVTDQNILKFAADSPFLKQAQEASDFGNHYSLRMSFSTTVKNEQSGKNETKTIRSNKAQLRILKKELRLLDVPNFDFGTIPAAYIYEGNLQNPLVSNNKLNIKDTRSSSDGWSLNVRMTPLTSNFNTNLDTSTLVNLSTASIFNSQIKDDNNSVSLLSSNGSQNFNINANILFQPNPKVILTQDETFSSTLNWTLVSGNVRAKGLD